MSSSKFLLACDLDRTLLPDGPDLLSDHAFNRFLEFIKHSKILLAYMTGRSFESTLSALNEYGYPLPQIINSDSGTTIYYRKTVEFIYDQKWETYISKKWKKGAASEIQAMLADMNGLKIQEKLNQNTYKVSYYLDESVNQKFIQKKILEKIKPLGIEVKLVFTINHIDHFGYLDIIPQNATKGDALKYLQMKFDIKRQNVLYAGDSGNDLEPLTMGYNSVVVNNASDIFKNEVKSLAQQKGIVHKVYIAKGGFQGMNGNYVGGILEAINFFGIES